MRAVADRLASAVRRPDLVDTAIAIVLFAGALIEALLADVSGPAAAKVIAVALTTLPLAWRSIAPLVVVGVTMTGFAIAVLAGLPNGELLLPYLSPVVAVYSVGVHGRTADLAAAAAMGLFAASVAVAFGDGGRAADIGYTAVGLGVALAVGRAVREMGLESDSLAARAAELERERDEKARAAVAAERARIARELHDVIGHSISVMGVQAGAVRRVLDPELEREREGLLAVERTGRDAVTEMRRLLGLLRSDEEGTPLAEPPPTLKRVDDLVAEMRRAGLDVDLRIEGDLDDLSAGRALVAFRILQEALTNSLRHAPGAHVDAAVRRRPGELEVEVTDDGNGRSPVPADGGYGLAGMRERVALYRGTLEAGPRPERGFAVLARIPTSDD